jgi:ubiquinone biosynthesis protein
MGSLSDFDQRYLAENFLAFMNRDYRRVAELHVESGWVPIDTRVDDFEFAIRSVCEPIFDRPIKDISVGHLLLRLFQTAQRFHMKILPQLLLLQKTLVNVEGIGRQLYPDLDLWAAARPSLERWMRNRISIRRLFREFRDRAPSWLERLPEVPDRVLDLLEQSREDHAQQRSEKTTLESLRQEIRRNGIRTARTVVGASLILSAMVLLGFENITLMKFGPAPLLTWILGGLGLAIVVAALSDDE